MKDHNVTRRLSLQSLTAVAAGMLGTGSETAANIARRGEQYVGVTVLPTIATLRDTVPSGGQDDAVVFVSGYHASDGPGGGGLFLWSRESAAPDDGGTVIKPSSQTAAKPGRWLRAFEGPISVKWFGATGDGITDDTAALQSAIDATHAGGSLVFPTGRYMVTTLDTRRCETNWRFENAELVGGAATATPCVLRMRGLHSRFSDVKINVAFNDHYACALWWYDPDNPSQHNEFRGLEIRYGRRGIVYGEMPGRKSTRLAQSENAVFGYHSRGIEKPLFVNHDNGVLFLSMAQLVAHNEEWERDRPGKFDAKGNYAFEAMAGTLVVEGGEIQNSIADLSSRCAIVDGGDVSLDGCIIEVNVPFQVCGHLTIRGGRILNTQSMTSQFVLPDRSEVETTLRISDCRMFRNAGTGSFSDRSLVMAPDAARRTEIVFSNCVISEWAKFAPLVAGSADRAQFNRCQWRPQGAVEETYFLDTGPSDLLEGRGIDRAGRSLAGFWAIGDPTGVSGLSADVPRPPYGRSLSIVGAQRAAGLFTLDATSPGTLQKTAIGVKAGDRFLVEAWVRRASGRVANLSVALFDAGGHPVSAGDEGFLVVCGVYQNFVSDHWRYVRQVVEIPSGLAAFAGFGGYATSGEIRFCGLRVRRADFA